MVTHSNWLCIIVIYDRGQKWIITIKRNKLLNPICALLTIVHYWLCICPDAGLTGYPWWCVAGMPMYPPPVRRRTNSLGSGNDGLDEGRHPEGRHPDARHPDARHPEARHPEGRHPDGRHPEPYERDPRMWLERSYMPPPPGKWTAWPNTPRLSLHCLAPFPWLTCSPALRQAEPVRGKWQLFHYMGNIYSRKSWPEFTERSLLLENGFPSNVCKAWKSCKVGWEQWHCCM